ncbi:MAG: hypothetical protein QM256_09780 [Pseudomonadota bacterium]|jgi:hypothetical protein|nr:hypothetical protein [Syntrophaceae bacterium]MBP7033213.1 hypothetical protein [Syntrophobacterales bacterium]MDI9556056.1 hypothetical protein [Pseudomonadota bacterium]NLX30338.1 hypothetical protein [Deltaproteobacteria bacterium]HNU84883.1 hypothetical protein [Syntrophales bacterium]
MKSEYDVTRMTPAEIAGLWSSLTKELADEFWKLEKRGAKVFLVRKNVKLDLASFNQSRPVMTR